MGFYKGESRNDALIYQTDVFPTDVLADILQKIIQQPYVLPTTIL